MRYRYLGRTGLSVSELCLGTMTFGRETDEAEAFRILDRFVAAGGTFVDTADSYTSGASEEIVGRWLARRGRDDMVIATKVFFPLGQDRRNDRGLSRRHLVA